MKVVRILILCLLSIGCFAQQNPPDSDKEEHFAIRKKAIDALRSIVDDDAGNKALQDKAMQILGEAGDPAIIQILWKRYEKSKELQVKSAAIIAIGKLGDREEIPNLRNIFESADKFSSPEDLAFTPPSLAAGIAMLTLSDRSGFVVMNAYLQGRDRQLQQRAISAFTYTKDTSSIELIVSLLGEKDVNVRLAAINALQQIAKPGDPYIIASLKPLLEDDNGRIAAAAAKTLGILGDKAGKEILIDELSKSKFRPDFLKILYFLGEKKKASELVKLLSSELTANERRDIEDALIEINDQSAAKDLIELLSGKNANAAVSAAKILAGNKDKAAIPTLLSCLNNDNNDVQIAAANALGKIGSKDVIKQLKEIMRALMDADPFETKKIAFRENLAVALGNLGDEDGIKYFIVETKRKDKSVIDINGIGLASIKNKTVIPVMLDALKNPDAEMTTASFVAIVHALESFNSVEALPIFVAMLSERGKSGDIDPMNREQLTAVIEFVGRLGTEKDMQSLESALHDKDAAVRLEAAAAIIALSKNVKVLQNESN